MLGFVESLLMMMVTPLLRDGAAHPNLVWLLVIFGYGCLMTLVLLVVQDKLITKLLGKEWRSAPTEDKVSSQIPPTRPTQVH